MKTAEEMRYALISTVVAVAAGLALFPVALTHGSDVLVWAFAGWLVATLIGVFCGTSLTAVHGNPGSGFLWLFGSFMAARVVTLLAGLGIAQWHDPAAAWAYLAGLGVAWLATQAFEMIWFARRTARAARSDEPVGYSR